MAKGQKRSNRELRKPKAKKPVAAASAPALPARAFLSKPGTAKAKG